MAVDPVMISCRRRGGFFSQVYELSVRSDVVGQLDFSDPNNGRLTVQGSLYSAVREGRSRWVLKRNGEIVAECLRIKSAPLNLQIVFDGTEWFIESEGRLSRTYTIYERAETIGCIEPKVGILSNKIEMTVPERGRLEICGFVVWLVGIHWSGIVGVAKAAVSGT